MTTKKRHTGGPHRVQGKAGLVSGCTYRSCDSCTRRVLVPAFSTWRTCTPCLMGWK